MKLFANNDNYKIYQGSMLDLLEVIKPNTIDSVVTDPRYELNIMNKGWDRSGIAFQPNTWKQCYKALKPGGYLLAFGGSRTFHRIAVAIEDAGFEIRDVIMWVYSSGFPKALDIEKQLKKMLKDFVNSGIMEVGDNNENGNEWEIPDEQKTEHNLRPLWEEYLQTTEFNEEKFREILQSFMQEQGLQVSRDSTSDVWGRQSCMEGRSDDEEEQGELQGCEICKMSERIYRDVKKRWIYNGTSISDGKALESNIEENRSDSSYRPQSVQQRNNEFDTIFIKWRTQKIRRITEKIKEISGWKTSLKPAYEPIIVARKPLKSTVAQNVMQYSVGGINIDECRVGDDERFLEPATPAKGTFNASFDSDYNGKTVSGRFPANFIHDGSDEVVELFPETEPSKSGFRGKQGSPFMGIDGTLPKDGTNTIRGHDDNGGSASRFFYTAKASKKDRDEGLGLFDEQSMTLLQGRKLGSAGAVMKDGKQNPYASSTTIKRNVHPTVKPCELMQYLVRLVTPKNGTVLDPFMGSGSTGKATMFENREREANYKFIGVDLDLDNQYCEIANARIDYALNKFIYDEQEIRKRDKAKGRMNIFDFMEE